MKIRGSAPCAVCAVGSLTEKSAMKGPASCILRPSSFVLRPALHTCTALMQMSWMSDAGCWLLDGKCGMPGAGFCLLAAGYTYCCGCGMPDLMPNWIMLDARKVNERERHSRTRIRTHPRIWIRIGIRMRMRMGMRIRCRWRWLWLQRCRATNSDSSWMNCDEAPPTNHLQQSAVGGHWDDHT